MGATIFKNFYLLLKRLIGNLIACLHSAFKISNSVVYSINKLIRHAISVIVITCAFCTCVIMSKCAVIYQKLSQGTSDDNFRYNILLIVLATNIENSNAYKEQE